MGVMNELHSVLKLKHNNNNDDNNDSSNLAELERNLDNLKIDQNLENQNQLFDAASYITNSTSNNVVEKNINDVMKSKPRRSTNLRRRQTRK